MHFVNEVYSQELESSATQTWNRKLLFAARFALMFVQLSLAELAARSRWRPLRGSFA